MPSVGYLLFVCDAVDGRFDGLTDGWAGSTGTARRRGGQGNMGGQAIERLPPKPVFRFKSFGCLFVRGACIARATTSNVQS